MSESDWKHIEKYKDQIIAGDTIAIIWSAEDVIYQAANMREDPIILTEEEIQSVLESLTNKHDATIGVNWDTIEYNIDNILQER